MTASSPADLPVHRFTADDGVEIAWRETGEGQPVVLIHGLFSNAWTNWVRYGHARRIAAAGVRLILPDLRGHGDSGRPHDPAFYPPDVLAADNLALVRHLGLTDYDLGGYSLGARTTVRMLLTGATPGRVVIAGMGLRGLHDTGQRGAFFRHVLENPGTFEKFSSEWMAEAFLKSTGGDRLALLPLLDSFVDTPEADIARIAQPVLVVAGEEDDDNGSAEALADALPDARFAAIPGNHMSAVARPELGEAIARFLAG
jgi:pimeloyl-ACP methyl ester carboxylesterase